MTSYSMVLWLYKGHNTMSLKTGICEMGIPFLISYKIYKYGCLIISLK